MKRKFRFAANPELLHCGGQLNRKHDRVWIYCAKHGTQIYSARIKRGFTLQKFWNAALPNVIRHRKAVEAGKIK
jgi:hypothetical protein